MRMVFQAGLIRLEQERQKQLISCGSPNGNCEVRTSVEFMLSILVQKESMIFQRDPSENCKKERKKSAPFLSSAAASRVMRPRGILLKSLGILPLRARIVEHCTKILEGQPV
jgi:hypothetical protein